MKDEVGVGSVVRLDWLIFLFCCGKVKELGFFEVGEVFNWFI